MIAKQVRDFLETGTISHSANFPTIEIGQTNGDIRLAIVNANIPNMVAQISSRLANAGLNIVSLVNKSRDDIAYTLIDIHDDVSEYIMREISKIEGVIQVRKLLSGKRNPALIAVK